MMYIIPEKEDIIIDKVGIWLDFNSWDGEKFRLREDAPEDVKKLYPEFLKIKLPNDDDLTDFFR